MYGVDERGTKEKGVTTSCNITTICILPKSLHTLAESIHLLGKSVSVVLTYGRAP